MYHIEDLGEFVRYEPDPFPDVPEVVIFCKRKHDDVDWYTLIGKHGEFTPSYTAQDGYIYAVVREGELETISKDPTKLFPQNRQLIAIRGYRGSDPQKDLSGWLLKDEELHPPKED